MNRLDGANYELALALHLNDLTREYDYRLLPEVLRRALDELGLKLVPAREPEISSR